MLETLATEIEIDFETLGIEPKGKIFKRASKILSDFPASGYSACCLNECVDFPVKSALRLLKCYVHCQEKLFKNYGIHTKGWLSKKLVWVFMNANMKGFLPEIIEFRDCIEKSAEVSELYSAVLDIIQEYKTYCLHKSEVEKHIKAQRKIVDSKRGKFFTDLAERDGLFCKVCGSNEKLRIDHIKPLSLGGFTVLENLQLLCCFCNGSKGDRAMDYVYRRMNKYRNLDKGISDYE
jgi:hypothetical protein